MALKIDLLRYIAYKNVSTEINNDKMFEQFVIKWWCNKYRIPDNDQRLLTKSLESIIIEYFEDKFINNPQELEAYEQGYDSAEEADEEWMKEEMGDEYHSDMDYLEGAKLVNNNEDIEDTFDTATLGGENI